MSTINNDAELRQALKQLDHKQQRETGADFVASVLHLSSDKRVSHAVDVARDSDASDDELLAAYKSARVATVDSRTRCGADCNWEEQAAHFVARGSAAMVAPKGVCKASDPPWQVVMSCRMAQNCALIAADDDSINDESENQYRIMNDYLTSR